MNNLPKWLKEQTIYTALIDELNNVTDNSRHFVKIKCPICNGDATGTWTTNESGKKILKSGGCASCKIYHIF